MRVLESEGSPDEVYVMSDADELDGRCMPLAEAIAGIKARGLGAIVSCIPGKLAYYYGEAGERRLLLSAEQGH